MESSVPMILPKGIVINTTNIYDEVASYSTVPADKVWEYWHVYTTTNKRLEDPTARRLENFWWHVWGSDRRFLSGRALARIYEDISVGPTIAPLQGPPNRWEGPNAPLVTRQLVLAHLSQERIAQQNRISSPPTTKPSDASAESLSCSTTSKPVAPHPILKKSRGPSSSGPRPTARFASPPESADEADKDVDFPSSGSTATTGLEMPLKPSKKKPTTAGKKFVVASAAARRRPLLPRKTSPQSPIQTTMASRDANFSTGSRAAGPPRPVSPMPERSSNLTGHDSEDAKESSARLPGPSAKALGKRPALPPRAMSERGGIASRQSLQSSSLAVLGAMGREKASLPRVQSYLGDGLHPKPPRAFSETTGLAGSSAVEPPPAMERSQSHNGYGRYSEARGSTQGLFTGATASMTNVAAQGTIIDQAGSLPVSSVLGSSLNEPLFPTPPLASSLLESRLTPTQPGSSASVPMGRTRSQLTLLLEREKARTGDRPRPKS
ncbi:hypothetical protein HRG_004524 [Hirsutella rhossiliensis]|uniref:Nitrogen regulatory protein areA GATA-like domain-containing protein n=1 Tax=Hirsutella rhossiliensis TaxID=111463 RepID=A0A9P8SIP4_9HYPO|nr:uncharacterized protein HRG_04524 [Hirsutella rhossiliensis]KAH0964096.1 hypothetical protein HRG_04524 [Hirsutella rhossiliensis]